MADSPMKGPEAGSGAGRGIWTRRDMQKDQEVDISTLADAVVDLANGDTEAAMAKVGAVREGEDQEPDA